MILTLLLPWKSSLKIPAVYVSEQYLKIYSPYPAQVKKIFVEKNQVVKKGQELIELFSPELDLKITKVRRKIQLIKTKLSRLSKSSGNLDQYMTLQQNLIALQNELDGLNRIKSKFLLRSPEDGKIKNFSNLSINQWISNLDELVGIVKFGTGSVVGFVKEEQIDKFKINEDAVFIPSNGQHSKVKLISQNFDLSAISILPYLSLSSNFGGPIATRSFVSGEYENRPESAYYQATFKLIKKDESMVWELPGYVHIEGYRYSPILNFIKKIFSLIIRESRI